jgi:hypothetical protein
MIDAMYKPWPKCPLCSRPMLLSGEVTLDKDGKPSSGFACDFCRAQPKPVSPVFGFSATDANAEVGAIHPKSMPVILTTPAEMSAPAEDALKLRRPLPDGPLNDETPSADSAPHTRAARARPAVHRLMRWLIRREL